MRDMALNSGHATLAKWQSIIEKEATLEKMHKSIAVGIAYLMQTAPALAQVRVQEAILACMPKAAEVITHDQCLSRLQKLQHSQLVQAAGMEASGSVKGVVALITDMRMGISPTSEAIHKYTGFDKQVLLCCEYLFVSPSAGGRGSAGVAADHADVPTAVLVARARDGARAVAAATRGVVRSHRAAAIAIASASFHAGWASGRASVDRTEIPTMNPNTPQADNELTT